MPKRKPAVPKRRAQLVADAVSVLCPWCSEPQPNSNDGSEQWIKEDFAREITGLRNGILKCCSCDGAMFVFNDTKAMFQ